MKKSLFVQKIYDSFGFITRTRGTFLYTKKNVRLTDLYLEDTRAILGWDGLSSFTFFKNYLSKGLNGSFIYEDKSRIEKAISVFFNSNRKVLFFSSKTDALKTALSFSKNNSSVYMPFLPNDIDFSTIDCIVFTPPLPYAQSIFILAIKTSLFNQLENSAPQIPQTTVPFSLQCAITKSIYNLKKEINIREEKDWFIYDTILTKYWTRKGPYLYPKIPKEQYDDFIIHCLSCSLVINPDYNSPSVVPYKADKGVFSKLKNNPFTFTGE